MGIFPQCKETDNPPSHLSQAVDVIMLSAMELGSTVCCFLLCKFRTKGYIFSTEFIIPLQSLLLCSISEFKNDKTW